MFKYLSKRISLPLTIALIVLVSAISGAIFALQPWKASQDKPSGMESIKITIAEKKEMTKEMGKVRGEIRNKTVNNVLPEGYDRESVKIFIVDLNGDGLNEMIIGAAPIGSNPPYFHFKEGYLGIITLVDQKGNYRKIIDHTFANHGTNQIPGIDCPDDILDIDGDGLKEIILNFGIGGASTEAYGIFKIDWDLNKLIWLKARKKDGSISNTSFLRGGTVTHQSYLWSEDLDSDGTLELIEEYRENIYMGAAQAPQDWEAEGNWKKEYRVYKWEGSIFSYSEALSALVNGRVD